jgi:glyoxylase-like metal-dependent hydrolase (beta-lactamase superfamily II)
MDEQLITLKSGRVNEYLHHIDMKAFGTSRMLSVFLGEFDDCSILLDCGSSLDIRKGLRYFKKQQIPLSSFKYLITSHHHFDHNGGIWKMYEEIKKYNPNVKILTNMITKELLNDYEIHLNRGKRTYGNLIGEMRSIEEPAFKIIEPSMNYNSDPRKLENIESFRFNDSEIKLGILKTAGHTPDHQSPVFIKDGMIDFIFLGEAAGTLYHDTSLVTMPTSMPIFYNHKDYMNTLANLKKIHPMRAGFGHFGVVNGRKNVSEIISEHQIFMDKFKSLILKSYNEDPRTTYVLEKIMPILLPRTNLSAERNPVLKSVGLAIVYGMMISLGLRQTLSPKEKEYLQKYS